MAIGIQNTFQFCFLPPPQTATSPVVLLGQSAKFLPLLLLILEDGGLVLGLEELMTPLSRFLLLSRRAPIKSFKVYGILSFSSTALSTHPLTPSLVPLEMTQ